MNRGIGQEAFGKDLREKILYKDECFAIQGAIFDVYREMGAGFLEAVYQECIFREFSVRKIPCVAQPELSLVYKGLSWLKNIGRISFVMRRSFSS